MTSALGLKRPARSIPSPSAARYLPARCWYTTPPGRPERARTYQRRPDLNPHGDGCYESVQPSNEDQHCTCRSPRQSGPVCVVQTMLWLGCGDVVAGGASVAGRSASGSIHSRLATRRRSEASTDLVGGLRPRSGCCSDRDGRRDSGSCSSPVVAPRARDGFRRWAASECWEIADRPVSPVPLTSKSLWQGGEVG